ncbi:MAG TPA: DUF5693 family protein [Bacillota bacterium]
MASRLARAFRDFWPVVTVLAVAAAAAVPVLQARIAAEAANDVVELVADLEEFEAFALREGLDPQQLWPALADAGVTSLALTEMTLERLEHQGRASLLEGADLAAAARRMGVHPLLQRVIDEGGGDPSRSYVLTEDREVFRRLLDAACTRTEAPCRSWFHEGLGVVEVPVHAEALEDTGLGIWPEDLATAARHGFFAVLRFQDHPNATPETIRAAFDAAAAEARLSTDIFDGTRVLGAAAGPAALDATAAALADHGLVLGLIESVDLLAHLPQEGMPRLLEALNYRAARTYSIAEEFLAQLEPREAVDIWTRSPVERNIRVIYLRPILREGDPDRWGTTLEAIRQLATDLTRTGWRLGPASTFPPVGPSAAQLWGLAAGVAGLAVLLLRRFLPLQPAGQVGAVLLALAGMAALQRLAGWNVVRELLALGTAVAAATLAIDIVLARWGRRFGREPGRGGAALPAPALVLADVALAAAVALCGGLLLAALLGDVRYLLEERYFRGVKLSLLMPPVLVLAAWFWRFGAGSPLGADPGTGAAGGEGGRARADGGAGEPGHGAGDTIRGVRARFLARMGELAAMAGEAVRWRHVVLGAVALAALVLYVTRSGNLSRDVVPALELALRTALEDHLGVRPRFKEFLLGYPALVLSGWMAARGLGGYLWINALAGAVGVTSLINSFEHLRTPVTVSLLRSLHGLWLGLALGLAAVAACELAWRLARRVSGRGAVGRWR